MQMTVSIIVPTRNRKKTLIETITEFYKQTVYPRELIEFIVINDGEEDLSDLQLLFNKYNCKIINNSGKGAAAARNTGIKISCNDLILFLDDDILVTPNHVSLHVSGHQQFTQALITAHREDSPKMLELFAQSSFGRYKAKYDYKWQVGHQSEQLHSRYYKIESLASFSCSVFKKHILEFGGFDESFPYAGCEDQEFSQRYKQHGFTLIYDKANLCYHNEIFNIELKNWLDRQYTGVQGYILLSELYSKNKFQLLYIENCPVYKNDNLKLKIKKVAKTLLSTMPITNLLFITVSLLEKLKLPDIILFKLYDLLFIAHIRRGFGVAYKKLISSKDA